LVDAGFLKCSSDGRPTNQKRLPISGNKNTRVYTLLPHFLGGYEMVDESAELSDDAINYRNMSERSSDEFRKRLIQKSELLGPVH
jgi:hypothetical protein